MEFTTGAQLGTHISKQCLKNPNRGIQKNSKIWKCSICGNDFLSRRRLQKHRKEEHDNEINRLLQTIKLQESSKNK